MRLACGKSEGRWINDDLAMQTLEGKVHFREAQVEANHHPQKADWRRKRGKNIGAPLDGPRRIITQAFLADGSVLYHLPALLQSRTVVYVNVEQVHFLISMRNHSILIDPDQSIFHLFPAQRRLVNPYVDGQPRKTSFALKAQDEHTIRHGSGQSDGLCGRGGDVVTCFGKEQSLRYKSLVESM